MMSFKEFLLTQPDHINPDAANHLYHEYRSKTETDNELSRWFHYSKDTDWMQSAYNPLRQRADLERARAECSKRAEKLLEVGRSRRIFEPRISALNRLQPVPQQAAAPVSTGSGAGAEEDAVMVIKDDGKESTSEKETSAMVVDESLVADTAAATAA